MIDDYVDLTETQKEMMGLNTSPEPERPPALPKARDYYDPILYQTPRWVYLGFVIAILTIGVLAYSVYNLNETAKNGAFKPENSANFNATVNNAYTTNIPVNTPVVNNYYNNWTTIVKNNCTA